jgi:UDP-glucose 4-epimerase
MKKVLITGNSGYIGSHLTQILNKEYEVYGLDIALPKVEDIKDWYNVDIRKLFNIEQEFDAVVHLAALVKVSESELMPISYYITNLNGTMNVLNKIKTKNFIFASTGTADKCSSAYGISKRAAEDCVREYCIKHKPTPYTIFRFYNVIGSDGIAPTNPDGLFYNLIKAQTTNEFTIFGNEYNTADGTAIRDYVHVNEICNAIKLAIETPSNSIENLGHGVGHSVKEIVDIFQQTNNTTFAVKTGPRRKGDIEVSVLDNPSPYMKKLYSIKDLLKV